MPLEFIRNDITKVHADAIVNAANNTLLGGSGVDGAIHRAAGPMLLEECRTLGGCETGHAKITKGYKLPAKYIIHTVGPIWRGGTHNEERLLKSCYINSLNLAKEYSLERIAFPLISSGAYGYPKDKAFKTAVSAISEFLLHNDMTVYLVIYHKEDFILSDKLSSSIDEFIDDRYVEENRDIGKHQFSMIQNASTQRLKEKDFSYFIAQDGIVEERKLEDLINQAEETFSESLLRLIDEKGMTDAETYKRANIDRKLFSKIRNNKNYRPKKSTALAFAIALRLNLDETKDLLRKAGYALSRSSIADIIVEYFITEGNYNIFEINEALFAYNQNTLGGQDIG